MIEVSPPSLTVVALQSNLRSRADDDTLTITSATPEFALLAALQKQGLLDRSKSILDDPTVTLRGSPDSAVLGALDRLGLLDASAQSSTTPFDDRTDTVAYTPPEASLLNKLIKQGLLDTTGKSDLVPAALAPLPTHLFFYNRFVRRSDGHHY